jgi:hypothetical protein
MRTESERKGPDMILWNADASDDVISRKDMRQMMSIDSVDPDPERHDM